MHKNDIRSYNHVNNSNWLLLSDVKDAFESSRFDLFAAVIEDVQTRNFKFNGQVTKDIDLLCEIVGNIALLRSIDRG